MFGFFSKKDETKNLLHGSDSQAENIFIHTMARDLESEVRSEKTPAKETAPESAPLASRINLGNLTVQQQTSPFLNKQPAANHIFPVPNQSKVEIVNKPPVPPVSPIRAFMPPRPTSNHAQPIPERASPKNILPEIKEAETDLAKAPKPEGRDFKRLILILSIILIATTILAGTYYFWNTRKSSRDTGPITEKPTTTENVENIPEQNVVNNEEPAISKFSTSGPNYLEVDINDPSPEAMKETLKSYVQEVQASGIKDALEFKVVTLEKSPVSLPTFFEKMKITFSPELASSLEDDFSLYIYNDQGGPGVGLALTIKKGLELEEILLKEEKKLPDELKNIFPVEQYVLEGNKSFSTSEYDSSLWGKIGVRYLNITSPENLSLDYAIINTGTEKFLLATTKETLRSVVEEQKATVPVP